MRTPRSYVRCVLARLGELVDPAETHLDDDVMDEALVRITAMANATMAELALISASFGSGPIRWRSPEPRTADAVYAAREVLIGFDGAYDVGAVLVVENRFGLVRALPWGDPSSDPLEDLRRAAQPPQDGEGR